MLPDVYGVFQFRVDYNRVGYTRLFSTTQVGNSIKYCYINAQEWIWYSYMIIKTSFFPIIKSKAEVTAFRKEIKAHKVKIQTLFVWTGQDYAHFQYIPLAKQQMDSYLSRKQCNIVKLIQKSWLHCQIFLKKGNFIQYLCHWYVSNQPIHWQWKEDAISIFVDRQNCLPLSWPSSTQINHHPNEMLGKWNKEHFVGIKAIYLAKKKAFKTRPNKQKHWCLTSFRDQHRPVFCFMFCSSEKLFTKVIDS